MKNILKVTILFCLIISIFVIVSYAASTADIIVYHDPCIVGWNPNNLNRVLRAYTSSSNGGASEFYVFYYSNKIVFAYDKNIVGTHDTIRCGVYNLDSESYASSAGLSWNNGSNELMVAYGTYDIPGGGYTILEGYNKFNSINDGLVAVRQLLNSNPSYTKNPNVDEFIANTLISMGIHYNQYSYAIPIASSAWNYIIDEDNWYIGSGDRNDKDIKWNIDAAVSYANAQSNNYKDWYNGYKVNKDLTVALAKFISDNYTASTVGEGTLAGYSVKYNSNYNYGTATGTSGFSGSFGSPPNALSFYPASTITYFNGAYLHDNDVIDQDEFVYTPADVRKFIGYPSTSGIIESPDNTPASGTITDGNGDTVYNIDLEFPSLDWLADAIQSLLDFLNRLITTIADFLTQILDAILSLFSDAFDSLTAFGQGLIEWLYSVVGSFSTLGSNYIPSSLWSILLPFIFLNIGVGLILFVLRSH